MDVALVLYLDGARAAVYGGACRRGRILAGRVTKAGVKDSRSRSRAHYAALFALTIAAGLASRRYPQWLPVVLARYAGDTLWAAMVFWMLAVIAPRRPTQLLANRRARRVLRRRTEPALPRVVAGCSAQFHVRRACARSRVSVVRSRVLHGWGWARRFAGQRVVRATVRLGRRNLTVDVQTELAFRFLPNELIAYRQIETLENM